MRGSVGTTESSVANIKKNGNLDNLRSCDITVFFVYGFILRCDKSMRYKIVLCEDSGYGMMDLGVDCTVSLCMQACDPVVMIYFPLQVTVLSSCDSFWVCIKTRNVMFDNYSFL